MIEWMPVLNTGTTPLGGGFVALVPIAIERKVLS